MNLFKKRARLAACAVGALTAATLALSTSPASASGTYSGLAYVYGGGQFEDDWGNEGILSTGTHTRSNATCLWQKILAAHGYLDFPSDIDGIFGTRTEAATKRLQDEWDVGVDGEVGRETFGRASRENLVQEGGSTDPGSTLELRYLGTHFNLDLVRESSGNYGFWDGDGNYRLAGYNYRTCG
ncbi:peptidoglycan-binding domain-containing protein [Streptomyces sp. NPDC002643]